MDYKKTSRDYALVAEEVFSVLRPEAEAWAAAIVNCIKQGNKVMICGNGGSAADAQHIAGEFLNRFFMERNPYPGMALSTDTSTITAIGNDYSFDLIFEKQVKGLGRPGDVLWAISTSGKAKNCLQAIRTAKSMGILTLVMTGGSGGEMIKEADRALCVKSVAVTPRIQEGHQLLFHIICQLIEEQLES